MFEEVFAVEFFAQVGEAVGPFVEVWLVYLVHITGENNLGPFSGTGDDGLHFVRGEVLGFVNDEERVGEGAATDVGERADEQLFAFEHLLYLYVFFTGITEVFLYYGKIVVKREHVRTNLLLGVAWKESDLLVFERDYRTGKKYLVVKVRLRQGSGQGYKCLSGAGSTGEGDEFDVGIKYCIHCKDLLVVAWGNAVGALLVNHHNVAGVVVVAGKQDIFVGKIKLVQLVARRGLVAEGAERQPFRGCLQLVHQLWICPFHGDYPLGGAVYTLLFDVVGEVILYEHPHCLGFHPQVHILGYQRHGPVGVVVLVPDGSGQDAVVLRIIAESPLQLLWKIAVHSNGKCPLVLPQRIAVPVEEPRIRNLVYSADELAGVVVDGVVAVLELVYLLEHCQRNY